MTVPLNQYLTAKYLPRHHKLSIQNKATYLPLCGCAFNFCQILTPTLTVKIYLLLLLCNWCLIGVFRLNGTSGSWTSGTWDHLEFRDPRICEIGISLVSGSTETYKSGACARTPNELPEFGSDFLLLGAQYFGNRDIVNAYLLTN